MLNHCLVENAFKTLLANSPVKFGRADQRHHVYSSISISARFKTRSSLSPCGKGLSPSS